MQHQYEIDKDDDNERSTKKNKTHTSHTSQHPSHKKVIFTCEKEERERELEANEKRNPSHRNETKHHY